MLLESLHTPRLLLRPLTLADAYRITELLQVKEISDNTLRIPYPYTLGDAVAFIRIMESQAERGETATFGIALRSSGGLIGALGLEPKPAHDCAEIGYWLGEEYWGRGYATEAARALVGFGFKVLKLHRIHAGHFTRNPASGRVLQKAGFQYEGCLRDRVKKGAGYENYEAYSILRSEWEERQGRA